MWKAIASVEDESNLRAETLYKGVGFVVWDGGDVRFRLDDWVGVGPFCGLFPRLFILVVKKDSSVRDCFELRGGCIVWGSR